jgi:hypothetical protein
MHFDSMCVLRIQAPARESTRGGLHDSSEQKASYIAPKPRARSQSRESREGEVHAGGKNRTSASKGSKESRVNLKYLEAKTLNLKLRVMNKVGSHELQEINGRTLCHDSEGIKMKPMNTDKHPDAKSKLREHALRKCYVLSKRHDDGSKSVNSAILEEPSKSMVSAI